MRILRGLTSRLLPCGCLAGVYETYDGAIVTLLDERQQTCVDPRHTDGSRIADFADGPKRARPAGARGSTRSR